MPAPASIDLRERAVKAYLAGEGTYVEVADRFEVGDASLRRWVKRFRVTGSVEPDPHGGGQYALINDEQLPRLRELVAERPDRTVDEIVAEWHRRMKVVLSRSAMLRSLKRAGLTFKKKRSAHPSSNATTSWSDAKRSGAASRRSIRTGSSSSTSRGATSR